MTLTTRDMIASDVPACAAILNDIISRGGTTAHEDQMSDQEFSDHYFKEPEVANVVLSDDRIIGFQAAFEVEPGIYSIGSFTLRDSGVRGAGRAVFDKTRADCKAAGGTAILAKITADNTPGLGFYSAMGFVDDHVIPNDHRRKSGELVDRIVKRYAL